MLLLLHRVYLLLKARVAAHVYYDLVLLFDVCTCSKDYKGKKDYKDPE